MVTATARAGAHALALGPVTRVTSAPMTISVLHVAYFAKQRRRAEAMVCVTSQDSVNVTVDISPTRAQSTVWTLRRAAAMANVTTAGNAYA